VNQELRQLRNRMAGHQGKTARETRIINRELRKKDQDMRKKDQEIQELRERLAVATKPSLS